MRAEPTSNAAAVARYRAKHPGRIKKYQADYRARNLQQCQERTRIAQWRRYGIDPVKATALLAQHDGHCDCCKRDVKGRGQIDHDHETGKLRGVLCGNCNKGIGLLRDSAEGVGQALAYLTKERKCNSST